MLLVSEILRNLQNLPNGPRIVASIDDSAELQPHVSSSHTIYIVNLTISFTIF